MIMMMLMQSQWVPTNVHLVWFDQRIKVCAAGTDTLS